MSRATRSINLLIALAITLTSGMSARAQGFDPSAVQPQQPSRAYSVRVTIGSHTNAGFEKNLVEGTPNLRHWTWVPVTSYDQGYIKCAPGTDGHGNSLLKKRTGGIYVKPNHVALPSRTYFMPTRPAQVRTARRSTSDVSGRVRIADSQPIRAYEAPPAEALSYSDVSGRINSAGTFGNIESKDVSGKLLKHVR